MVSEQTQNSFCAVGEQSALSHLYFQWMGPPIEFNIYRSITFLSMIMKGFRPPIESNIYRSITFLSMIMKEYRVKQCAKGSVRKQ